MSEQRLDRLFCIRCGERLHLPGHEQRKGHKPVYVGNDFALHALSPQDRETGAFGR